jgi:hypothetical protein
MGTVPKIDFAGTELLAALLRDFRARGIIFRIADAHGEVRDALRRIDFEREHGSIEATHTVAAVVTVWQDTSR